MGLKGRRSGLAMLAAAAVLAAVLHLHAVPDPSRGPFMDNGEGPCPVCATVRGGMELAPAVFDLPLLADPPALVPTRPESHPRTRLTRNPVSRGPPLPTAA